MVKYILMTALFSFALSSNFAAAKTKKKDAKKMTSSNNPVVVIETSKGMIEVELWQDKAPKTVANFIAYAKKGFYDGTIFHRVIDGFMIQGGGFTPDMKQKPTDKPIENEAKSDVKNLKYTVAMARTSDPHSATAQFFINVKDNSFLDQPASPAGKKPTKYGYAVFGKVVKGMDVVDAIKKVKTASKGMYQDVPVETVTIKKAYPKKQSA